METPVSPNFDASPAGERPVNPKLLLPRADQALFDIGVAVKSRWEATPALTLLWLTPTAYATALTDFGGNLTDKRRIAAERTHRSSA